MAEDSVNDESLEENGSQEQSEQPEQPEQPEHQRDVPSKLISVPSRRWRRNAAGPNTMLPRAPRHRT